MKTREHISSPYRAHTGAVITSKAHIDTYNKIQDDINIWIRAYRPVPEWLLDWSHRYFVSMCDSAE